MSDNFGGFSNIVFQNSSSSSSNDDDYTVWMTNVFPNEDAVAATYRCILNNNNMTLELSRNHLNNNNTNGGSILGHIIINRDREAADSNLWNDYFSEHPRYNAEMFQRWFQMSRNLFLRIVEAVKSMMCTFNSVDSLGRLGLSSLQKIMVAFRMLAYGVPTDATDEYVKIGESIVVERLKRFCCAIVEIFADRYLRSPMRIISQNYFTSVSNMAFQECWEVWTVCIGSGKIVLQHRLGNTEDVMGHQPSFSKLW